MEIIDFLDSAQFGNKQDDIDSLLDYLHMEYADECGRSLAANESIGGAITFLLEKIGSLVLKLFSLLFGIRTGGNKLSSKPGKVFYNQHDILKSDEISQDEKKFFTYLEKQPDTLIFPTINDKLLFMRNELRVFPDSLKAYKVSNIARFKSENSETIRFSRISSKYGYTPCGELIKKFEYFLDNLATVSMTEIDERRELVNDVISASEQQGSEKRKFDEIATKRKKRLSNIGLVDMRIGNNTYTVRSPNPEEMKSLTYTVDRENESGEAKQLTFHESVELIKGYEEYIEYLAVQSNHFHKNMHALFLKIKADSNNRELANKLSESIQTLKRLTGYNNHALFSLQTFYPASSYIGEAKLVGFFDEYIEYAGELRAFIISLAYRIGFSRIMK